jgi:glycosyltransferase involved in cell wall biosynthesis
MLAAFYPGKPRILMLNTVRGTIGGVERLMIGLAKELLSQGWEVYGLFERTWKEDEGFDSAFTAIEVADEVVIEELIQHYKEIGIELVLIHKCTHHRWISLLQTAFKTAVMVHDHDYYCLRRHKYFPLQRTNCHLPFNPVYCSICSALLEKQGGAIKPINLQHRWQLLQSVRKCDLSFVLSDYMKQNLIKNGWDKNKIRLLIPEQKIYGNSRVDAKEQIVILYAGQLIKGKGVDLLLRALALVKQDYICKIAGTGNDLMPLKRLSDKLQIADRIEFIGWCDDVHSQYQASDIVIIPSRWQEPFALVGLEAFAHGKAVIAFDVGGISQWLKHRVNGMLIRAGSIENMAKSIQLLIANPTLRNALGQAGIDSLKANYNHEVHHNSFVPALERLLSSKR